MRAEEYLTILTDQIRCRMARKAVREESRCHIEDQTAAFLSEGMEQAESCRVSYTEFHAGKVDRRRRGSSLSCSICSMLFLRQCWERQ